jgi:predicted dinucleotide-binding enzyme
VAAFIKTLGLRLLDAGNLKMAHWLEGMGLITVSLANNGIGHWNFALSTTEPTG